MRLFQFLNGERDMSTLSKLSEAFHYKLDNFRNSPTTIKIEALSFNKTTKQIMAKYRLGRQKLLNTLDILSLESRFFDQLTHYDQLRTVKFASLQNLLNKTHNEDMTESTPIISYIQEETENAQLF